MMKRTKASLFVAAAAVSAIAVPLVSQDAPPPAAPAPAASAADASAPPRPDPPKEGEPMNKEQLDYSIWFVKQHIDTRSQRAAEIIDDIKRLDGRVEGDIDRVLKLLEDHRDSVDSHSSIARLKIQAMEGLKKTIQYYDMRRRTLKSDFMRPDPKIDRDTILEDLDKFNARVEKRVDQIIELAKTMQGYKDVDKWIDDPRGGNYYWGHLVVRNPEYLHNKSQTAKAEREQNNIVDELKDNIKQLKLTEKSIENVLKGDITQQFRDLLEGELERISGLISTREEQMQMVITTDSGPVGSSVNSNQARNIESLVGDIIKDLKHDFFTMFQYYDDLNRERAQLKELHKQLDGYTAELEALKDK